MFFDILSISSRESKCHEQPHPELGEVGFNISRNSPDTCT